MAMPSGRFFGWVIGGTLPAALAADWLVSAWDQNAGMRYATPGVVAAEEAAGAWLLDLLGLPAGSDVGFVTGATMANFTGLAAGRACRACHGPAGTSSSDGLTGAPARPRPRRRRAARHGRPGAALSRSRRAAAGRRRRPGPDPRRCARRRRSSELATGEPVIVCLQAGNLHSGAFDPFAEAIELAHAHGAWVHVDGAFGLVGGGHRRALRPLVAGVAAADSWATDAHKTLNVPYDCGIAIVADPVACAPRSACTPAT